MSLIVSQAAEYETGGGPQLILILILI